MARNALLKQYLDAGMQFTQMTRERAEVIVKDLVQQGEVRRKQANQLVDELVDRSRANAEQLLETVRREVQDQLALLDTVSKDAFTRLEEQVGQLRSQIEGRLSSTPGRRTPEPAAAAPAKKAAAKKAPAKKQAATKKAAAKKKAAARKAPAKKA